MIKVTKRKGKILYNPLEVYFGITNFRENYELFYEYLMTRYNKLNNYKNLYKALNNKSEEELSNVLKALAMYGVDPTKMNSSKVEDEKENNSNQENLVAENDVKKDDE